MPNNKTYYIGGSKFNVVYRDIAKAFADVIVSSDDTDITMSSGVSRSILEAGSELIQIDAQKHKKLKIGDVIVSTAGELSSKYIFHTITLDRFTETNIDKVNLEKALKRILELGNALNVKSIALPAIGTGTAGYNYTDSVQVISDTIGKFLNENNSIEEVTLCLLKRNDVSKEQMNELFENAVEFVSIKEQNREIKTLLQDANKNLKLNKTVNSNTITQLELGISRISTIEKEIIPTQIPNLLKDLSFLYDLLHSVNSNKNEIQQLQEDKRVFEQSINYQRTALRHYEIEKAKYGGEMVPFRLLMSIEEVEKEIKSLEEKIIEINSQLNLLIGVN